MKSIIILGDGMADEPNATIQNKTCLQVAHTPHLDQLAKMGKNGTFDTIPKGYTPGSEIANLSVLGYDVDSVYEGRGALEAASMGVDIIPNEMAMRCNLICIEKGIIKNHSAGHISTEEANILIEYLQKELGDEAFSFYCGVSYRHLFKMKNGNKHLHCTPPHDVPNTPFDTVMIKAEKEEAQETAKKLNDLILKSQELLEQHPINIERAKKGKDKANSIWLWSPGYKPQMPTLNEKFNIGKGSVISAVDLIRGIGVYAGLTVIEVSGITGLYDTNYEGKAAAAIEALKNDEFVYLHIEASDEAGHEGDVPLKIKTIENLDSRIVKPILTYLLGTQENFTIALLPDHPTPCAIRIHTKTPIPFVIYRPNMTPDKVQHYNEFEAQEGEYGMVKGDEFMKLFVEK